LAAQDYVLANDIVMWPHFTMTAKIAGNSWPWRQWHCALTLYVHPRHIVDGY